MSSIALFRNKVQGSYIPALDGLRAIAVFLVIFYHFGFEKVNGAFGVEIFFVLSGFLITKLLLRENDKTGDISLSSFYKRRTLRIFPAFYAYLLFGLATQLLRNQDIPWSSIIASSLYVQNYYDGIMHVGSSFVSHTWSLGVEEQFYVIWSLIFWVLRKDLAKLTKVLCAMIVGVWIYRIFLYFGLGVYQGYIYHAFETRADHLFVGCLLAIVLQYEKMNYFIQRICAKWYYPYLTIELMYLLASMHGNLSYRYGIGYALDSLLIGVFIIQMIWFSAHPIWGVLENRFMRYLGHISYSLYLYQQLTLYTARRLTAEYAIGIQLLFGVMVTIGFAVISHHGIEKPFLRLRDRKKCSVNVAIVSREKSVVTV